jgi:hypothetical protein
VSQLEGCIRCQIPIIGACPSCGAKTALPANGQRSFRLANGQNLAIAFCRTCATACAPEEFPTILATVRLRYEQLWAAQGTPAAQRQTLRETMRDWDVVGWADEIPGLEHVLPGALAAREAKAASDQEP